MLQNWRNKQDGQQGEAPQQSRHSHESFRNFQEAGSQIDQQLDSTRKFCSCLCCALRDQLLGRREPRLRQRQHRSHCYIGTSSTAPVMASICFALGIVPGRYCEIGAQGTVLRGKAEVRRPLPQSQQRSHRQHEGSQHMCVQGARASS